MLLSVFLREQERQSNETRQMKESDLAKSTDSDKHVAELQDRYFYSNL